MEGYESSDCYIDYEVHQLNNENEPDDWVKSFEWLTTLRLSNMIVIGLVSKIQGKSSSPSLTDYELAYDALHFFLIVAKAPTLRIPASYIQNNWASCHDDYIGRLNWLKSIGVLEGKGKFRARSKRLALKTRQARELSLGPSWWFQIEEIRQAGPSEPPMPYGFQPHFASIVGTLADAERKSLFKSLPRRFMQGLTGKAPLQNSKQAQLCIHQNKLSAYLNKKHGSLKPSLGKSPRINPLSRLWQLGRLAYYPDLRHPYFARNPHAKEFAGQCMNRELMKEYDQKMRLLSFTQPIDVDPEDPDGPNCEVFEYMGTDSLGNPVIAYGSMKIALLPLPEKFRKPAQSA